MRHMRIKAKSFLLKSAILLEILTILELRNQWLRILFQCDGMKPLFFPSLVLPNSPYSPLQPISTNREKTTQLAWLKSLNHRCEDAEASVIHWTTFYLLLPSLHLRCKVQKDHTRLVEKSERKHLKIQSKPPTSETHWTPANLIELGRLIMRIKFSRCWFFFHKTQT